MSLIIEFLDVAARHSAKLALITERSQLTYAALTDLVATLDLALSRNGVQHGQTVVLASKRPEFVIAMPLLASLRSLNVIFANDKTVTASGVQIDHYIADNLSDLMPDRQQITINAEWFTSMVDGTSLKAISNDGGGSLTFSSSGSTGRPKLIRCSLASWRSSLAARTKRTDIPFGLHRVMSVVGATARWAMDTHFSALLEGGAVVALTTEKSAMPDYVDMYRISFLSLTPELMRQITAYENSKQLLSSVQCVEFGGAAISTSLLQSFCRVCDAKIYLRYGATELGQLTHAIIDPMAEFPDGYIGRICRDDSEVGFFDAQRNLLPDATEGLIGIRVTGAASGTHYLSENDDPEDIAGIEGEWFFPGEIMRQEGEDYFLIGRAKAIANLGGQKVSLDALQIALEAELPNHRIVVVNAAGGSGFDQLVVAHLAGTALTLDETNAALRRHLPRHSVDQIHAVSEFPMTSTGKVDTPALRRMLNLQ